MGTEFKENEEHRDAVTRDPEVAQEVKQRIEAIKRAGAESVTAAPAPPSVTVGATQPTGIAPARPEIPLQDPAVEQHSEAERQRNWTKWERSWKPRDAR